MTFPWWCLLTGAKKSFRIIHCHFSILLPDKWWIASTTILNLHALPFYRMWKFHTTNGTLSRSHLIHLPIIYFPSLLIAAAAFQIDSIAMTQKYKETFLTNFLSPNVIVWELSCADERGKDKVDEKLVRIILSWLMRIGRVNLHFLYIFKFSSFQFCLQNEQFHATNSFWRQQCQWQYKHAIMVWLSYPQSFHS